MPNSRQERRYRFVLYRHPASRASVEGEAPSGFAGGGGDASPFKIGGFDEGVSL